MKRIVSLLFAMVMAVNLLSFTVVNAHASALSDEEKTLLELVGVIDEEKELDSILTKGEFAGILAKIAFGLNADVSIYNNGKKVRDVMESDSCYDAVNALYARGYITVDEFGCFYPEREITLEEATDMAVGVLGYSKTFLNKVFNRNTQSIAAEKGLYKGIISSEGKVSLYNAYKIIFNALTCDVSDLVIFGESEDELMYMSSKLSLYEVEGIVTDDGFTSLYGKTEIGEDYIAIDGNVLENKTEYADLLGYNVTGYYEYSKLTDEATLLAIGERNNKNDVTVLLTEDIEEFSDRTYVYYEDEFSAKAKKIELPKDVVVVYNGKSLNLEDDFESAKFVPEHGRVTLHDNDKDGKVEIVKIEDYKTAIVALENAQEEKIYLKNNLPAIELREKKVVIEDENGKKLDSFFGALKENDVISYIESIDEEYVKIIVSNYSQTETVSSVEYENGEIVAVKTSLGGIYKLTPYAQENFDPIENGASYKFYFDAFDMVAAYERNTQENDWLWGSLVSIKLDEDSGEDMSIAKIYTTDDEFVNLKVNKKVKVILEDDSVARYTSAAASNITYTGIIRYKTNSDDYVTCIELPHAYGSKPTVDDRLFILMDTVKTESAKDYYTRKQGNYVSYGGIAIINDNTKVFAVPYDVKEYEDYGISSVNAFSNGVEYEMYLYATDYRSKNAECACLTSGSVSTTNITDERPMTVKNVEFTYDEEKGEPIYRVTCMTYNGVEKEYYMEQDVYENEVFNYAAGDGDNSPVKIQKGDMIYYSANGDELLAAVLIYDADRILTDERGNEVVGGVAGGKVTYYSPTNLFCSPFGGANYLPGQAGNINSWKYYGAVVRIWVGWVYSVEDGFFQITNQNPAYGYNHSATKEDGFITEIFGTDTAFVTTEIDGKKVDVKKGTVADIKPYTIYGSDCSRVIITQRVYDLRSFNIVNY